ncbi:MAG TPA: hypothetical protein DCR44_05845 [Acholeplasmatales bacterium]|nr:MAG: hypothetical protein A2Y16_06075 [Tenericutes bacterium GWF2_57_13]HAQ56901.1 hypothetical protein [Acholeplasmatales bacterium]
MKKLIVLTMMIMTSVMIGCSLDTTGVTTEAITTQSTTTETTTTAEPLDVAAIFNMASARFEDLVATYDTEPLEGVEGAFSRASLFAAYARYEEYYHNKPRPLSYIHNPVRNALTEIGEVIASDLVLENGSTYRYDETATYDEWSASFEKSIQFSADPDNAITYLNRTTYFDSLGIVESQGISGTKIGYDAFGRIHIEVFGISYDPESDGIGGYSYMRYIEGVEYFQLYNSLLCSGFGMIHLSYVDQSKTEIYSVPDSCDGEGVYGGDYGVAYRAAGDAVESAVHVVDGALDRFTIRFKVAGIQVFWVDMVNIPDPTSTWYAMWNLHYATGWDSLRTIGPNDATLYDADLAVLDDVSFNDSNGTVNYLMNAEAAAFTDDVLDLSAFGLAFYGAVLDNTTLEAYRDEAYAAIADRMVWNDVDFLDGNPWEQGKVLLPSWMFDLVAQTFGSGD